LLDRERLLATIALEQAFSVAAGGEPDRETLSLLLLERGVDLAKVLRILSSLEREEGRVAWPVGATPASAVERSWAEAASEAKRLVAEGLASINEIPLHERGPFLGKRAEVRPLGRSPWRTLVATCNTAPLTVDRLLSLVGSL